MHLGDALNTIYLGSSVEVVESWRNIIATPNSTSTCPHNGDIHKLFLPRVNRSDHDQLLRVSRVSRQLKMIAVDNAGTAALTLSSNLLIKGRVSNYKAEGKQSGRIKN